MVNVSTGLILFTLYVELNTILSSDQFLGTPQSSTSEYSITNQSSCFGIEKIEYVPALILLASIITSVVKLIFVLLSAPVLQILS